MKFGDNLKYLRKVNNLSQEKLAEKLGVSRQSVSKWECSEAYPEMKHILVLCDLFHCKINDLVHSNLSDIYELDEEIQQSVVKFKKDKQDKMQLFSKLIYMFSKYWKFCSIFTLICVVLCVFTVPGILFSGKASEFISELSIDVIWMSNFKPMIILLIFEIIFAIGIINCVCHLKLSNHLLNLSMNFYVQKTPFIYENIVHIKKIIVYLIGALLFSVINQSIYASLEASQFVLKGNIIYLVIIIIAFLIIYLFEYGYEIQKDSCGVMYGEIDEEEKKNAISFLNKNIMQYTKKIIIIGIVGLFLVLGFLFSKMQFDFLSNLPMESEKEVEVVFSLEELGYAESDVVDANVYSASDGTFSYSLRLDNSTSQLTPSKQHYDFLFEVYQYPSADMAIKNYLSLMTKDKRNHMYNDNYEKGLAHDTYYYITTQNIEEYMLAMDAKLWNADKAYMLYNKETYSAKYANPSNYLYILKDNEILFIRLDNLR